MSNMQRFVVTGANKGIGLATVKGLLDAGEDNFVFLGSRDVSRGQRAVDELVGEKSESYSGRVEVLEIDVSNADSVSRAAAAVRSRLNDSTSAPLAGLINNAGIALPDFSPSAFQSTMSVNVHGVIRVTDAFLPLLDPAKGRVVMISSSSGPSFVAKCTAERQALLVNPSVTHAQITAFADECLSMAASSGSADDAAKTFAAAGLTGAENMAGYGVTKALVNMYTAQLAREHPSLVVNACTPGFIATELAKPFQERMGKTLDEMGAKPPSDGAKTPVFLATGDVPGSGWYFGSDSQRSPLDRYREPGSPAYEGK